MVPKKLNALTSLRFIAAALIVVHHSRGSFGIPQSVGEPFVLDHGVAFFFVLSGFVLAYVYPSLDAVGTRRFLQARFARVWPGHVAALVLAVILLPEPSLQDSIARLAANLAMVHAWIPLRSYYFSFNAPSWSISTEFGFYLCFPLLICSWRRTCVAKLSVTVLMAAALITLSNALRIPYGAEGLAQQAFIYVNPLGRLFEFTLGMTAALVWRNIRPRVSLTPAFGTLLEMTAIGLAILVMYRSASWAYEAARWVGPAGCAWLLHGGLPSLTFATLIVVMALERGLISWFLSLSFPVLLGEISYSVYLIHVTLINYYKMQMRALALGGFPAVAAYGMLWALILLGAHLMWVTIERPCRKFLVQLWPRHSPVVCRADRTSSAVATAHDPVESSALWGVRWNGIAAEATVLLSLVLLLGYWAHAGSGARFVDQAYAEQVRDRSPDALRGVEFGNRFTLFGADFKRTSEALSIELVWHSAARQRLQWRVLVHVVDASGRILNQADYPQDTARSEVPGGAFWRDVITIPSEMLHDATAVAIGLYGPGSDDLVADRGPRDWGGHRLLLALPAT